MLRTLCALLGIANTPVLVLAQGTPGTNIAVEVKVSRIAMRGDTVRIESVVKNAASSQESLFQFTVDAPSKVIRIELPAPGENWDTSTTYKTLAVASWGILDALPPPGTATPPLVFEALGLPGIVTYWAMGWFPVPAYNPEDEPPPPMSPREAITASTVQGLAVGVEPFPNDRSAGNLLTRLLSSTDQSCGSLAWITSATVCTSLKGKLQQASQALTQGDDNAARTQLQSFLTELDAQHDAQGTLPVKDNAYWLLKVNAEYVLGLIPETAPGPAGAPTNLVASNITANSATVGWANGDASAGTTTFVQYRVTGQPAWITANGGAGLPAGESSYSLTGLQCAKSYDVSVYHQKSGVNSTSLTRTTLFTTGACVPPAGPPTNLAASNITATSATISWTNGDASATTVVQYRLTGSTTWITANGGAALPAGQSSYALTGLHCATSYDVNVFHQKNGLNSSWLTLTLFTTAACQISTAINPPSSFRVTGCTPSTQAGKQYATYTVTWVAGANPSTSLYHIGEKTTNSPATASVIRRGPIATVSANVGPYLVTSTASPRYFWVRHVNGESASGWVALLGNPIQVKGGCLA
jgi:hypothetical protein